MAYATTDDGVKLFFEEVGRGDLVVFVHEFAGNLRSWEAQLRYFGQRYHCVAFNARGYPPSDVPEHVTAYSQERAADDIKVIVDHIGAERGHIVGLSMGGFATLHYGLRHPTRARSLCVAGCGYGAEPSQRQRFKDEADVIAEFILKKGMPAFAEAYAYGPSRVQFENRDPRGFAEFKQMLAGNSALGSANTQRGVQRERPSLYDLLDEMKKLTVPILIMTGDEDWPCLLPGVLMKQTIPSAALSVIPNSGHAINIEMPDEFNRILSEFLSLVERGRWAMRDPRAVSASLTGIT